MEGGEKEVDTESGEREEEGEKDADEDTPLLQLFVFLLPLPRLRLCPSLESGRRGSAPPRSRQAYEPPCRPASLDLKGGRGRERGRREFGLLLEEDQTAREAKRREKINRKD